jgi:hypothetical protein
MCIDKPSTSSVKYLCRKVQYTERLQSLRVALHQMEVQLLDLVKATYHMPLLRSHLDAELVHLRTLLLGDRPQL